MAWFPISRSLALVTLAASLCAVGCSSDETNPPVLDMSGGGTTGGMGSGTTGDGSSTSTPSDDTSTAGVDDSGTSGDSGGSDSGTTGERPLNCDDLQCTGHGTCEIGKNGDAYCACDEGYVLDERGTECVVDETCIRLRPLEEHCRQLNDGPPAVSVFFAVDFCSGTAVLPDKFAELGLSFVVNENGIDITTNPESDYTIVPTTVESYVTLAIDVSDSVTQSGDLPALVAELRGLVQALEPAPGGPDVYVSIYVFGRFVAEYVPFTRDFAALDDALATIETDPDSVVSLVSGNGTALYHAVARGIDRTQRIRDMRDAVSWGGVLSTGTVVVITDGQDSVNATLDAAQLQQTLNQVITIGISDDVDHADLDTIGRDGSFLAPTAAEWPLAFDEVAQRVEEYPERAYLLAYCSSATTGNPDVEVVVDAKTKLTVAASAACTFDADSFSSDPGATCSQELFSNECLTAECGGLTACGACPDTQCCNGFQCMGPAVADDVGLECSGFHQLCSATGEICVEDPGVDTCEPPDTVGGDCDPGCTPGESWCSGGTCLAAQPFGTTCDQAVHCQSLNCQQTNPENPNQLRTCQLPALAHDRCEGAGRVVCEEGSFCQGNRCTPQRIDFESCSNPLQCRSGLCTAPVDSNICLASGACFWSWNEKVPS
jgi:hypothetical protein